MGAQQEQRERWIEHALDIACDMVFKGDAEMVEGRFQHGLNEILVHHANGAVTVIYRDFDTRIGKSI